MRLRPPVSPAYRTPPAVGRHSKHCRDTRRLVKAIAGKTAGCICGTGRSHG